MHERVCAPQDGKDLSVIAEGKGQREIIKLLLSVGLVRVPARVCVVISCDVV